MLPRLSCFWRNRSGNFSTLTAIMFPVVLLGAGLTLNTGTLFLQQRNQQQVTDLAALTATAHLTNANRAALMTFDDNGLSGMNLVGADPTSATSDDAMDRIQVEPGHYDRNVAKPMTDRFVAGASPINAVRVRAHRKGEIHFPTPVLADTVIGTTATALIAPEASFSIGSRLADVNTQESLILNSVLGGLLGTSLKLEASNYRALLNTDVDALGFMDALATELNLTAGTYQQVLDSSASVGDLLKAAAKVPSVSADAKTALSRILTALPTKPGPFRLDRLIGLDKAARTKIGSSQNTPRSVVTPRLALLDLINAAAALSNGTNQISIKTGLNIPGLTNVTMDIAVGEPPQSSAYLKTGGLGAVVYTAQTRVRLVATVGVLPEVPLLKLLPTAEITVPLLLDVGSARGQMTAISCRSHDPSTAVVSIDARPALAQMYVADVPNPQDIRILQVCRS